MRSLVAGIDSSTQSCKVMIHDADSGALARSGVAHHATGTEVNPAVWERALHEAIKQAGGLKDVKALSIAGQQHGMVPLDEFGKVVRNSILWNDTRSAPDAEDLINEMGDGEENVGKKVWAERTGLVPVASFTVTKIRWMARKEPENLKKTAAVCLPHDWLTWKLNGTDRIDELTSDRSDASGTGYFNSETNRYDMDLVKQAMNNSGKEIILPKIVASNEIAGETRINGHNIVLGAGCGDNAGAALGLSLNPGQVVLSIGTSGVVSLVSSQPIADETGYVAGFADATGNFLPLVATLNASRVLDTFANLLGVDHEKFSKLALSAPPGAEGLVCIPYLEGERTPNLPDATGALHGIQNNNLSPANVARAAVEGMLCGVSEGIHAVRRLGVDISSVMLIGGGARSEAVRRIAPTILGLPVYVPERGEYVADGAALQAAWALQGGETPPKWTPRLSSEFIGAHQNFIEQRYHDISHLVSSRQLREK
ncbi:xylulokinase [Arcanobacterium ihumii]|uniref:xylulokinase n=1 Tax=Arcanobacterium ihumii TaxID=2138162 RepID=UPI000F521F03|nr:xylulokinase [Arcanobacterium ihumii]